MNIDVTEQEANIARQILEQGHRELLLEIARADHHEFRIALQEREKLLKGLLDKLRSFDVVRS